jgi:RsiW-degrading membrane proteinase PrsW (M82 family)
LPALLLCWYIYAKDRQEKEPWWLLAALFGSGFVIFIPSAFAQHYATKLVDVAFAPFITYSLTGVANFSSEGAFAAHTAVVALAVTATVELLKWLVLYLITYKSKHFGHLFDGLVYAVFVSLGFAAAENIWFALTNGWDTLLLRSVTTVPAHMTCGVLMGFCYTLWRTYRSAAAREKQLAQSGRIRIGKPFRTAVWLVASIVVPCLLSAFRHFAGGYGDDLVSALYYIVLVACYVVAFLSIRRLSGADDKNIEIVHSIVLRKYPALSEASTAPDKQ